MIKRLQLFIILLILSLSHSYAQQVGDVCNNPAIANLCGGNTFSASTANFSNNVSSWEVGNQTIQAGGADIFYQINLPASSYQPVNLYASLAGYFPKCTGCNGTIYFLWFESSPCSANPVAVNSYAIFGDSLVQDSVFVTFPVTNSQSQYYLVIDFSYGNYNYSDAYNYNLQLGFSNNQPLSTLTCSPAPAPYKGTLALDQSKCYTASNPYQLPLTSLNDNPADSNILYPDTLSKDLKYLPISDDNGNGFILSIKTTVGVQNLSGSYNESEIYQWFDQFPYHYSTSNNNSVNYTYDVDLTVFLKNNQGASGLKGFRIQAPGNYYFDLKGLPNRKGIYDTSGIWVVNYDNNNDTYMWLFKSKSGRGDNIDNTGYSCRAYTFDGIFASLGNSINAWYLPDNYGNDSLACEYSASNLPRTDCDMAPGNYEQGWIAIGGSGGSSSINGQSCGTQQSVNLGVDFQACDPYQSNKDYASASFDNNGCTNEIDYGYDYEYFDFTDNAISAQGKTVYGAICNGKPYQMILEGNGFYNGIVSPTTVVYFDSTTNIYHPVDSLGNILYNENYYSLSIPNDLPVYPNKLSTESFTIPLSVPGTYTLIYTEDTIHYSMYYPYYSSYNYYPSDCKAGNLIIVSEANPTVSLSWLDTTICKWHNLNIYAQGAYNYSWKPTSAIYSPYDSSYKGIVDPLSNTTYTVIGTSQYGCSSSPVNFSVNVNNCPPKAVFNFYIDYCGEFCGYANDESLYYPNNWQWSFPGGTPSSATGSDVTVVCYKTSGIYPMKLVVSNAAGKDSVTNYIQVGTCNVLPYVTVKDSIICSGSCISFYNQTPYYQNVVSFKWVFPGGNPDTVSTFGLDSAYTCYVDTGTFISELITVGTYNNVVDTFKLPIHVINCGPIKPGAAFTVADSVCNNSCISVSNTSTGNPTNYLWNFNGGTPSFYSGQTPPNICYANPGNYSIQLIVSDSVGSDTTSKTILVENCTPAASFTEPDSVCNANCITVNNSSSLNTTSWLWSFEGGNPSSFSGENPPNVCYNTQGSYSIQLIAGNSSGNDTIVKTIMVNKCVPVASFTSPDSVCNANCMTVSNFSSSNSTSWQWSFAGGIPLTYNGQMPPNICYANPGKYSIQLIVSNSSGSDTATKIIVVNNCNPKAIFKTNDTICATDCITITDSSSVNVTSYLWVFNGGVPSTFNGKNPPNICYGKQGNYVIQLIVSNGSGSDTSAKTIVVNNCNPNAAFSVNDSICATDCIAVSDSSSANVVSYSWVFNGGSPLAYDGQNPPNVCFNGPGNYSIQLIVGNKYGNDTVVKTIVVNNCKPIAILSAHDSICETDCVSIAGSSSGNVTQWQWFFAGGNPSTFNSQTPPNVCYDTVGNYVVELIASNKYGSDTVYQSLNVKDCSTKAGIKGVDSICAGNCVTFLNESLANSTGWQWSFVGGSPSSYIGQNPPEVCYQNGGKITVQLIASNNYGSDTAYKTITVFSPIAGNITAYANAFCEGTSPLLNLNNSSGSVQWQVSDTTFNFLNISGDTDSVCRIAALNHNLYLRVVSKSGNCTDTSVIFKVVVFAPLAFNYTWKDSGLSVVFNSILDSLKNINYSWSFGDGDTSSSPNPVHSFPKDSSYYVCLSVFETGYENCANTYCSYLNVGISATANLSGQNSIEIYPDPFSDFLLIKADNKKIKNIELHDMLGRQIINKTIEAGGSTDNVIRLDVSNITNGMYYIRIKTDGADYIQNVVKFN